MTTGDPKRAELPPEIERARKLVRLHADQPDHAAAGGADALGRCGHVDDGVALVAGIDLDVDVGTEHAVIGALPHQPIDAGERVRRQSRAQPLDDIAVLVVMRRLDQLDPKRALGQITVQTILRTEPDCSRGNRPRLCGFGRRFARNSCPAALLFTFPWRGKVDARSAAGWGESARSALQIPASPRTPPRVPSGRDPPPAGEGEASAFFRAIQQPARIERNATRDSIGTVVPGFRFAPSGLRSSCTIKGGGALIDATVRDPRRANARYHLSALGAWARLRARTPTGAPPRHLWQRTNATAQLQPALPGTWRHRVLPASGLSIQSSGLPRSTGRSAGRAYPPKPPECGVQIRPREPHSPRIQVCLENTSLRWARYLCS